jgi:hypothetical protein
MSWGIHRVNPTCLECGVKLVNGYSLLCKPCRGRLSRKPIVAKFCLDCGISVKYGLRCKSCSNKNISQSLSSRVKKRMKSLGKDNPFYGKKHSKKTKRKLSLILGGTGIPYENDEYGAEFDTSLKEQIRLRENYKCKECGCSQVENGKQLDVHHIDYDKKNNNMTNLVALCMKCHRKTNHHRDYWEKHCEQLLKNV